ncbi:MAG: HypC/HybG/HupF family hydrogenase formation chaperone [bacterium]|nr:HypC/HybG/HupF family hydrogenase formation chaperone [bacterium]
MCLSIPCKIISVNGDWAEVETAGNSRKINLTLIKNAQMGDYVLVHGDLAINKIEGDEALKIQSFLSETNLNARNK